MASQNTVSSSGGRPAAPRDCVAGMATPRLSRRSGRLTSASDQIGLARSTRGGDCDASRRVLTNTTNTWHAPAMRAGMLRARLLARSADARTLSHVRRRTWKVRSTGPRRGRRLGINWPKWLRRHVQGTVGGTVTGRWIASVDRVERNLAVIGSQNGERCSRPEEALQEV